MAYAGSRLEWIENQVRDFTNDDDSVFMGQTTQFTRFANAVQKDIANGGYWKKETSFDASTSQTYTTTTVISDLVKLLGLRWYDSDYWVEKVKSYEAYQERVRDESSVTGTPSFWFHQSNTLYVWPVPTATVTNGWTAYHSYTPTALDTTTNYTPAIPTDYDNVYVYGILWRIAMRDATRPGYDADASSWKSLYDKELRALLSQGRNRMVSLIPYR